MDTAYTKPTVGRIVHYVSYGSPNGEYKSEHRAAVVVEVIDSLKVILCVLNPKGIFFTEAVYNNNADAGTWHWPERE